MIFHARPSFWGTGWRGAVAACLVWAGSLGMASAQPLPRLEVTVFTPPSQSVWLPALVSRLALDRKHGFELVVTPKPSKVAYTDFATGRDPVCFCAAIAAVSRFKQQGADFSLLWNIFNFETDIIVRDPALKTVQDLEGRTLLADTVTGAWALTRWFLEARGVDLDKVTIRSTSASGGAGVAELEVGRVDAYQVNPTASAAAVARSGGTLRSLGVFDAAAWRRASGSDFLPAIALGVSNPWLAETGNQDLLRRFYAALQEAVAYLRADTVEAARLVAGDARMDAAALLQVFERYRDDVIRVEPLNRHRSSVALLTQKLLPEIGQLPRPLTDAELDGLVSSFDPEGR